MTAAQSDRSALVTGGAHRIGRAIVEDLARHGWAVAIHYGSSRTEAERAAGAINAAGGRAAAVGGDLSDLATASRIVDAAAKAIGSLTLLVNNAAVYEKDGAGHLDAALWHRQLAINLGAPVFLADAFAAQLPDGAEGNIVNLLDPRVFKPTPDYLSYQVSKSALLAATEALAKALAPQIRVNGIAPGPTVPSAATTPERFAARTARLPLQRAPDLADFGRTVRFLVENRSTTGQVIALDSGQRID